MTETPQQPSGPNFGSRTDPETEQAIQEEQNPRREDREDREEDRPLTRAEVEEILAERDRRHSEELAQARAGFPQSSVAMYAGGPGVDNHQPSWSQVEQEAAARGEKLDHWV